MGKVNTAHLDWRSLDHGNTRFRRKKLGDSTDGEKLACSLYELPPGSRSWPYHYHTTNEEAMYVLAGTGTLRLADDTVAITEGDYVAFPANEHGTHRVINDSDEPLTYLMISTMEEPDVIVYPDSEKIGVFAGSPPGGPKDREVHGYFRLEDAVSYWSGEEDQPMDE